MSPRTWLLLADSWRGSVGSRASSTWAAVTSTSEIGFQFFGTYVACDVAREVLEENKVRYSNLDVEFRQLDIISDDFPDADVCIIRQVLQHLSNADIAQIVKKLHKFQILILTEPLPRSEFTPNLDQPTGVSSRLARGIPSGVVLTEPPFSLQVTASEEICSTMDDFSNARLVTTAFRLK